MFSYKTISKIIIPLIFLTAILNNNMFAQETGQEIETQNSSLAQQQTSENKILEKILSLLNIQNNKGIKYSIDSKTLTKLILLINEKEKDQKWNVSTFPLKIIKELFFLTSSVAAGIIISKGIDTINGGNGTSNDIIPTGTTISCLTYFLIKNIEQFYDYLKSDKIYISKDEVEKIISELTKLPKA